MPNLIPSTPAPRNEPIGSYAPGSAERKSLKAKLEELMAKEVEVPVIAGEQEIRTGKTGENRAPHDHGHVLGTYHLAGEKEVALAIESARNARGHWGAMHWEDRAAIFLKAADLLAGPYRDEINAATMLGQSKNVFQAEIDAACELIDFWRFNVCFMEQLYGVQPESADGIWNTMDYRPLDGFVFAVSPFNFTSIAGNLPTAPALMGNTALWKPASTQTYSAWVIMKVLHEAGLPPGVISFLPGAGPDVGDPVLASPELAGIHFTGSTATFQHLWKSVGENIDHYQCYPRLVGETGGKDFVFAHPSAHVQSLIVALLRGAFEYQGQKCSAASRAFIPESLWDDVVTGLKEAMGNIKMGSPLDFRNFMCAVIDRNAYDSISGYIEHARSSDDHEILVGGECDDSTGYFISPTLVQADKPDARLMSEEIFGPVLTLYRYPDGAMEKTLAEVEKASPYALTGAIFCRDRNDILHMSNALRFAAGNFYINDKPTGAVVGQQPFGGSRASGTNDKAGSIYNLVRWMSPRTIKETFAPPQDFRYPHMAEE
ncbi:MAG: L-glutamate gamma-semialdehyde dehydrogenase [Gammaproteobacteria bacterium]